MPDLAPLWPPYLARILPPRPATPRIVCRRGRVCECEVGSCEDAGLVDFLNEPVP